MPRFGQNVRERVGAAAAATVAACCWLGGLTGCANTRPHVARSAAEVHDQAAADPGKSESSDAGWGGEATPAPVSDLDFFDELERRQAVSFDDAIHALLLVATGESVAGYGARIEAARRMGWIDPVFNRPGRQAATTGEIARMLVRSLGEAGTAEGRTPGGAPAVRRLQSLGILPAAARPESGLTGAQYLGLLANARPAIERRTSSLTRAHVEGAQAALVPPQSDPPPARGGSSEGESFDDFGGVAPSPPGPTVAIHDRAGAAPVEPDPPGDLRSRTVPRAMPEPLPDVPALPPITESAPRETDREPEPVPPQPDERWAPSHSNPAISKPRPSAWVRGRPFTQSVKPE